MPGEEWCPPRTRDRWNARRGTTLLLKKADSPREVLHYSGTQKSARQVDLMVDPEEQLNLPKRSLLSLDRDLSDHNRMK
jgi:hypothetical protein